MKKLLIISIILSTLSSNLFADCINAYQAKSDRRARAIHNAKVGAMITGTALLAGGALVAPPLLIALGPQIIFLQAVGSVGTFAAMIGGASALGVAAMDVPHGEVNNYTRALYAITSAEEGKITEDFLKKLNKEIKLESFSDERQVEILEDVISIIAKANSEELLCPLNKHNKIKVMSYKKLLKFVVSDLKL